MKKSFTLIEVLVSIFLLSLLLASLMFAFKLFIKRLNNIVYELPNKSINYELLYKNISAFYPYFLQSKDKQHLRLFLKINKNSIEYISKYPLYFNKMVISKIECKKNHLMYFESLLFSKKQNYNSPIIFLKDYNKTLFSYKKICNIKVIRNKKNLFPRLVEITLDNDKMIFPIMSNFYRLKILLKENL